LIVIFTSISHFTHLTRCPKVLDQIRGIYFDPETEYYIEYTENDANASTDIEVVDKFYPNPLGVYGMTNQVSEWVNG
ncbi:hypothetical protein Q4491_21490, partial [Photobacterium sp. 2_MG-2023]|nr:hypothetical protein [Photobacterium sp. 2_MG-2023]